MADPATTAAAAADVAAVVKKCKAHVSALQQVSDLEGVMAASAAYLAQLHGVSTCASSSGGLLGFPQCQLPFAFADARDALGQSRLCLYGNSGPVLPMSAAVRGPCGPAAGEAVRARQPDAGT